MSFLRNYAVLTILSSFILQNVDGGWLDRKAEGWFWYEDREKIKKSNEEKLEEILTPNATPSPSFSSMSAAEEMTLIRKELEERLSRAILIPSEENVLSYMQMQQQWINQSNQFSQIWLKNILNHPELDSRLSAAPITQYGAQIQKQILREQREERIQSLVNSYGLFFFYEGNSKISQAFSFVVKEFTKKYSWQVIAISCDGTFISGFENNQMDHGITQRLGVKNFPSLFIVEPKNQINLPVAFGLSSVDQIEENIDIQLNPQLRNFP